MVAPGLSRRNRSLLNLAMISALNRPHELRLHVKAALRNGLTRVRLPQNGLAVSRARALVEGIAYGRARQSDFVDFAKLDFKELTDLHAGVLNELGDLVEFKLFDRREHCAETAYRYRARYAQGMVEVRLGLGSTGKVTSLEAVPLHDWTAPL